MLACPPPPPPGSFLGPRCPCQPVSGCMCPWGSSFLPLVAGHHVAALRETGAGGGPGGPGGCRASCRPWPGSAWGAPELALGSDSGPCVRVACVPATEEPPCPSEQGLGPVSRPPPSVWSARAFGHVPCKQRSTKGRMRLQSRWKAVAGIRQFGSKTWRVLCQLPPCRAPICLPALGLGS